MQTTISGTLLTLKGAEMEVKLAEYPRPSTRLQQAHQIWPILTAWATFKIKGKLKQSGKITYGELAKILGYATQAGHTLSDALSVISCFCEKADIPHLNVIVVNQQTGLPGYGIPESGVAHPDMYERVLQFAWVSYRNPTLSILKESVRLAKSK